MPLFYFNIRNGSDLERDPDGTELPNLASAHAEALVVSRELAGAIPEFNDDTLIEIADEAGRTLLIVPFSARTACCAWR
jgi:hypothetical protein